MSATVSDAVGSSMDVVTPARNDVAIHTITERKLQTSTKKHAKSGQITNSPTTGRCGCANQQKQRDKEFAEHKAHILANLGSNACDLSPKGSVDAKCRAIMDILNTHADFITTSSCSGRIALFHSVQSGDEESRGDGAQKPAAATGAKMKRGGTEALGWLVVKHGMLLPQEMLLAVRCLCGQPDSDADRALDEDKLARWKAEVAGHEGDAAYQGELEGVLIPTDPTSTRAMAVEQKVPTWGNIAIKMEPFVMHVECRTIESAKELLSAAVSDAGYRNSGVVPPGKKIMCGIRSAVGLGMEVPVVLGGENYVSHGHRAYVWALVELANEKMRANELKTKLLERSIAKRVAALSEKSRKAQV